MEGGAPIYINLALYLGIQHSAWYAKFRPQFPTVQIYLTIGEFLRFQLPVDEFLTLNPDQSGYLWPAEGDARWFFIDI